MKKLYAVLNLIVTVAVILWNYLANSMEINGNSVGEVSAEYTNLFTPAGYAFAIWGIIFLGLLANAIYQLKVAFKDDPGKQSQLLTGPWLIIANLANGLWIWCWLNEYTGISVIVMTILLLALIITILKLNLEKWNAPKDIIIFGWWPVTIYAGWISVALIANTAAYLTKLGWNNEVNEVKLTVIMIVIAACINGFMLIFRNMREFCAVGIWALIAIAVKNGDTSSAIETSAYTCAAILFIGSGIHFYINRKNNSLFNS